MSLQINKYDDFQKEKGLFDSSYYKFRSVGGLHPVSQSPRRKIVNGNLKEHAVQVLHTLHVVTYVRQVVALGLSVKF